MNTIPLLDVRHLKCYYSSRKGTTRAVDDVSFSVHHSKTLGIVGESGCGKSSLAMALIGVLPPNGYYAGGEISLNGTNIASLPESELRRVRWSKISMVFQGAMNALNPVLPVGDQIVEALMAHEDVSEQEAQNRAVEITETVGLPKSRLNSYPHEFSGGMRQRAVIAMSLICKPELVIADEPTTALDVVVQDSILNELRSLQAKYRIALILISHDLSLVAERCDRIAIMYAGKIVEHADAISLFKSPSHPYTRALLRSIPNIRGPLERLTALPGWPPSLMMLPQGCRFHPRCTFAREVCLESPPTVEVEPGHYADCHFARDILAGTCQPNKDTDDGT